MENEELLSCLTENELAFCELFVNGCAPYCGNGAKCYEEVFQAKSNTLKGKAKSLLSKAHIKNHIKKLEDEILEDAKYLKNRISENLLKIMEETADASFTDRRGTKLSPAPLRSVSVQAAKALMEIHPIKEAQVSKLNIEGAEGGGITFNVIVPTPERQRETDNN